MQTSALRLLASPRVAASALLVAALLTIAGNLMGLVPLVFVCKPLATLVIIGHAFTRGAAQPLQRRWVLAGLVLSLVGDVALLWPRQGFLPGLVSFLLAHLCYLWAFTRERRLAAWPWSFVAYAGIAAVILSQLWPGVPPALRVPVLAYVVCLAAMAAQAGVIGWFGRGTPRAVPAAVLALGGLLFMSSDALLAINKFGAPLPLAPLWILATYWSAQWCIASWLPLAEEARTQ